MNVELVNPVLKNVVDMLGLMARLELAPGKPQLKKGDKSLGEVTGMLRINGEGIMGSVAISFSRSLILALCRRMLRRQPSAIDPWVLDLAGEIANMVTGSTKVLLEEKGYRLTMSLPEVLNGAGHVIKHHAPMKVIVVPFRCQEGELYVEMCIDYDPQACPVARKATTG
ncbi:MAG: chemotaxis protein CheX [Gammaproteobacteria bacterium]|nr:chemotaxis protein CheX [Gammaproteobacteria bacterium]